MNFWQRLCRQVGILLSDESFVFVLQKVEAFVAKLLSIAMVIVVLVSVFDLGIFLLEELVSEPRGFFSTTLIEIFGLFLSILVALEVLENITAYLKKHIVQVELVVATSLTAVARKIIIFDFSKSSWLELVALAVAIFTLSVSYWLVRRTNRYRD